MHQGLHRYHHIRYLLPLMALFFAGPALAEKKAATPGFGRLESIYGSNTQVLPLQAQREASSKFSSTPYGGGHETRNLLFLNGNEKKSHWLFAQNNQLILQSQQLRQPTEPLVPGQSPRPTLALYLEVIKQDSNGDEKLGLEDSRTIALVRPDGSAYTEILPSVRRVLSYEIVNGNELGLVYVQDSNLIYARYAVDSFRKTMEITVATAPELP